MRRHWLICSLRGFVYQRVGAGVEVYNDRELLFGVITVTIIDDKLIHAIIHVY